jgi:signal transduction histidine kinase
MKRKYMIWLIVVWVMIVLASFLWNYSAIVSSNKKVVLNKSKAFFEQIVVSRSWNSRHGGVYVPISEGIRPNPYLKDSLRDLLTVQGMQLTKINPAYMTRQIAEINKTNHDLQFHITSLKPIRPGNKADEWEHQALTLFEGGLSEIIELVQKDSSSQYRYMASLITEESCLKCHAEHGYQLGDIRGGISISFPAELYDKVMHAQFSSLIAIHFLILVLGLIGLILFYRMSNKYYAIIMDKNAELNVSNATKDKFFSIIAHDLKSPFNVILGFSSLLEKEYDDFTEAERRKLIHELDRSSKTAYDLSENLLLWSRSQSDKITIAKEKLNVKMLVDEAIEPYLPGVENKGIQVLTSNDDGLIINADKFTTSNIIGNLFNNAVKFTHKSGNIKITAVQMTGFVEIAVSDDGVGIPAGILPGLFLPENSISTLGTANEKGTGLGLLLCKEFAEKNGGTIAVKSTLGKGSIFRIKLPSAT